MSSAPKFFKKREDAPVTVRQVEAYTSSIRELFFIRHPEFKSGMPAAEAPLAEFLKNTTIPELWIYYPDQNVLVHAVAEEIYFELRTARNRNIITAEEQAKYRDYAIGIAGLSVGSAILRALVMSGGPRRIKIADFDVLEVTNLNRLNASLLEVGRNKADIAAAKAWEVDPFAEIAVWEKGIAAETLPDFLTAEPKVDCLIDEMDNIALKIKARMLAKQLRLPVVMSTDNGDGVILDVERFDENPERPIFHGLAEDMYPETLENIDFKTWVQLAAKIVGPDFLPVRMKESIAEIGKTIAAIPQIGPSAEMAGAAVCYAVRRMANDQPMPSGRYVISLEKAISPDGAAVLTGANAKI